MGRMHRAMAGAIEVFADLDVSVNGDHISVKADGDSISISLPAFGSVRRIRGMMFDRLQNILTFLRGQGIQVLIFAGNTKIATLGAKERRAV